jgi:serine/threonine protein kinase
LASPGKFPGELQEGDIVGGSCTILDYIGRGAMGHVYRVRHNALNSEYALKMLSGDQVNEDALRRFQREAHAISIMSHPNVVRIYDIGLHDGRLPFYAMELLVGADLGVKIRNSGPIAANTAAALFIEVCAGISYAHKKGIVHRDIKPSNIFLLDKPGASGETAKVVDFGIVKLSHNVDPLNQALTGGGDVIGTPSFMSPESCMGQPIDARSDIYSLGCTLFEVLTGVLPFRGKNPGETMLMHTQSPPPTLKEASGGKEFSAVLEMVVAKALAKAPADRYQTMDQMSQDLSSVIQESKWSAIAKEDATAEKSPAPATSNNSGIAKNKTLLIVAPVVAGILIIGGAIYLNKANAPKDAKPVQTTTRVKSSAPKIADKAAEIDHGDDLFYSEPEKKNSLRQPPDRLPHGQKATAALLSATPFASVITKGGRQMRRFDFPEDVAIGLFKTKSPELQVLTKGIMEYPLSKHITFVPSELVGLDAFCLTRFQPGDLFGISFFPNACTDQIFKATHNLKEIRKLNLKGCRGLTEDCLSTLDDFRDLKFFDASNSDLDGHFLAKAGCWNNLEDLTLHSTKNVLPFLQRLKRSKALRKIDIATSRLTGAEFQALGALPKLTELDLSGVPMTPQDLSSLSTLENLTDLQIGETGLDGSSLDSIKDFKSLTHLDFSGNKISNKDLAALIKMRNFTELDLQGTGLDASMADVLKGYGSLKKLQIDSKALKPGDMKKIRDALPKVEVI